MAVVYKQVIYEEKCFECDQCKETKPFSLSAELIGIQRNNASWWWDYLNNRCLCSDCYNKIITSWYNQQEIESFKLQSDSRKKIKRKTPAWAG